MSGDNREERQARSLALERAYVHDVYDRIAHHFADTLYRPWPRVREFLEDLEPGSLVADIGCGNGKYLDINPDVMKIGLEYCAALTEAARSRGGHEVLTCDNLHLPFRDETFDAVLSVAVVHHFATTERRVAAIKEMTRVTRIGGKVLITVWAMEQRHRKFDSQDVLVPWHEPVKSSSEDRGSSVERELTSTTTSDDDVLVYHAYSHISDGEGHQTSSSHTTRKKLKYRNGRGRYTRASDHHQHSSQSSSELSSPNETCYSFVRRAFQKLSAGPYSDSFSRKSNSRPYFYRSCRKPCVSDSMEFGSTTCKDSRPSSPRNEFQKQDSIESEYQENEDDIPIEIRHLEGYETCKNCGSPEFGNCESGGGHVCTVCLPPTSDSDSSKKSSRSLGDFLNMIPKLLRVKKCDKEPLSDLHKRISTASDPREYVVKTRGANVNGIVRSKSTVSFMSRLEELMSMSASSGGGKDGQEERVANPNCSAGPRSKFTKPPPRLLPPSLDSSVLVEGCDGKISILKSDNYPEKTDKSLTDCKTTNKSPADKSVSPSPRHVSPADALRKLRQDMSLDESDSKDEDTEKKLQNSELSLTGDDNSQISSSSSSVKEAEKETGIVSKYTGEVVSGESPSDPQELKAENTSEGYLSSYYSMPELYKLMDDQIPEDSIFNVQRQKTISFLEQAQNILGDVSTNSNDLTSRNDNASLTLNYRAMERCCVNIPQRGLVKRSLSVDTGDNASACHQVPRRFSASAAQGVLASALRTYTLPRSCSRGSSVKSDTSVDSEESIVSVIPRKGNSITSDTSVDSEESVISVIQRSTSDIDALGNGLRNMSRFGSRSAQASPVTVLSSQTSSAESSPPQSGKNDGRFPGNAGVIDQLMQQQNLMCCSQAEAAGYGISDHGLRTRRCLLRPISDPRIEEKLGCCSHIALEDSNTSGMSVNTKPPSSTEEPKISRSFELGETGSFERKEQLLASLRKFSSSDSATKPSSLQGISTEKEIVQQDNSGELSRTPSPVGPIRYITDPLITGIEVSSSDAESKAKCLRFDSEVTDLEQKRTSPNHHRIISTSAEDLAPELNNSNKDEAYNALEKNGQSISSGCLENPNISKSPVPDDCSPKESNTGKMTDSEVRRSLFKLKERLESLTSGVNQSSGQGFDLFKNVSHTFGSLKNIKEKIDTETTNAAPSTAADANKECKVSPTPKSLNDSRQSSLDESSLVTLSDESVMSVEGTTSSVSDEANDYRRTDEDDDIDSSQNITVRKATDVDKCQPSSSKAPLNALTEASQGSTTHTKLDSIVENGLPTTMHRQPKVPSFSDTELHSRKGGVRCSLRKRLRRSCVTIDEVECRDFISSEDTSPSSSVSLEWNDFDKIETDSSSGAAAASCSVTTVATASDSTQPSSAIEICCGDVNVAAEAETLKLNVLGDKEMCVFFETSSCSSMGKSASSSSNATDFSTTSTTDRCMRGTMQREKSDDRSSKESDSDNLSKLSDVEARSDSAFEDGQSAARRTDVLVVTSSSSLDVLDSSSARARLGEYEVATKVRQTSNWVLHNIDEIPDDDEDHQNRDSSDPPDGSGAKSPTPSTSSWSTEQDLAQKKENFLSCAADCRDMYRISFDDSKGKIVRGESYKESDKSKDSKDSPAAPVASTSKENCGNAPESNNVGSSSRLNGTVGLRLPELAPEMLFPPRYANNDGQTDILAAFVETISDLTAVFQELYPRQESKYEDMSSDESAAVEISSFERILTSSDLPPAPMRQDSVTVDNKENHKDDNSDKRPDDSKKSLNESAYTTPPTTDKSSSKSSHNSHYNIGQTFVKLPPESDKDSKKSEIDDDNLKSKKEKRKPENDANKGDVKDDVVKSKDKTEIKDKSTSLSKDQKLSNSKKSNLKSLNRSSQSVCLGRVRQQDDSFDKEDESTSSTQSAPCSPRTKPPRQRSVEEVMSGGRTAADLSRTSSLSQSTSQESLPGGEAARGGGGGGLMACHRYYHVFRQGELDSLIENHVDNLHIISSYYDHANWCIVAEKVQVWTI